MARYDKNCAVCGKVYQYCTNCDQFSNYPAYMAMFCSQECVDLMNVLPRFEDGSISKEEAKKVVEKYPKDKVKMLNKSFAEAYAKVMGDTEGQKEEAPQPIKEKTDIEIANNTVKKAVYDSTREASANVSRSIAYRNNKKRH